MVFWVTAIHSAAGSLLITEAGGTVSDLDGRPWTIGSDSFVGAASPRLHADVLELLLTTGPSALPATLSGSGPATRARSAR